MAFAVSIFSEGFGRDYTVALHCTGTVLLIKAGGKNTNSGGPTRPVLPIFNLEPVCIDFLLFQLNSGPSKSLE